MIKMIKFHFEANSSDRMSYNPLTLASPPANVILFRMFNIFNAMTDPA